MRSRTSLFNRPVFRSNMSRYWPVWGAFLVVYLLSFPSILLSRVAPIASGVQDASELFYAARAFINSANDPGAVLNAVFAVIAAMAVFSFMYNTRLTGMTASLPVKRESVFFTCWFSGLIWLLAAPVIAAAVMFAGEALLHYVTAEYILRWLLTCVLELVFFYGLASLCAVLTGTLYILPLVYAIFNVLAVVLEAIISAVLDVFVYGVTAGTTFISAVFSPVVYMLRENSSIVYEVNSDGVGVNPVGIEYAGMKALILFAAVGIVFSLLALLIYRKRRMEAATDIVAIKALKPVFRWCMAIGCALTLGLVFDYAIFGRLSTDSAFCLVICMLVAGFIGWFGSEMLMRKSFRVFDKWRGFIVFAVIVIAVMLCLDFDVFGYEKYTPAPEKVEGVVVTTDGEIYEATDTDKIKDVTELHRALIEDRGTPGKPVYTPLVTLNYKLKSGRYVSRTYTVCGDAAAEKLLDFWNSPDVLLDRSTFSDGVTRKNLYGAWCDYLHDGAGYSFEINAEDAVKLYDECVIPDLKDGTLGLMELYRSDGFDYSPADYEGTVPVPTEIYDFQTAEKYGIETGTYYDLSFQVYVTGSDGDRDLHYVSFAVNENASRTFEYLEHLRLLDEAGVAKTN